MTPDPDVQQFARDRLGPASERRTLQSEAAQRIEAGLGEGLDVEDAVLREIHRAAADDPELAGEFMAYFMGDLMRVGGATLSRGLHRFVDTGDLVQSVLGDVWPDLAQARFETRGRFLAFLARRIDWKAAGKARKLRTERDARAVDTREEPEPHAPQRSALTALEAEDDREQILRKLLRLKDRDRQLLTFHLNETPIPRIAEELDLSREATYKALQRAIERYRALS